jgi:hypothetical protein
MKVSIALKIDQPNTGGAMKAQEGDIVAVCPAGSKWGTEEVKHYLILEVDLGPTIDTIEDARKLMTPQYADGALCSKGVDAQGNSLDAAISAKRRYNILFTDLDVLAKAQGITVDWKNVRNLKTVHQPFEKTTISFANTITDKFASQKVSAVDLSAIKMVNK